MIKSLSPFRRHCINTALILACLSSSGTAHAAWDLDDSWFMTTRLFWYCKATVNGTVVMTTAGRHTEGEARAMLEGTYPASSITCTLE